MHTDHDSEGVVDALAGEFVRIGGSEGRTPAPILSLRTGADIPSAVLLRVESLASDRFVFVVGIEPTAALL